KRRFVNSLLVCARRGGPEVKRLSQLAPTSSRPARSRDVLLANYRGAAQVAFMPRRPAVITQADVRRVIRAAKQAGASEVEVRLGDQAKILVRLSPGEATP